MHACALGPAHNETNDLISNQHPLIVCNVKKFDYYEQIVLIKLAHCKLDLVPVSHLLHPTYMYIYINAPNQPLLFGPLFSQPRLSHGQF